MPWLHSARRSVMIRERQRWSGMDSVRLNNTLQEDWTAAPDSGAQWSHCAVAPLFVTYMCLAGIRPLAPGFRRLEVRPQLADLESLELTAHTVRGPVQFHAHRQAAGHELTVSIPTACDRELVVPAGLLPLEGGKVVGGWERFSIPRGKRLTVHLPRA